jgi:hypothetical protein
MGHVDGEWTGGGAQEVAPARPYTKHDQHCCPAFIKIPPLYPFLLGENLHQVSVSPNHRPEIIPASPVHRESPTSQRKTSPLQYGVQLGPN